SDETEQMQPQASTGGLHKTKTTRRAGLLISSRASSFLRCISPAAALRLPGLLDLFQRLLDFCFLLVGDIGVRGPLIKLSRLHLQAQCIFHGAVFIDAA